MSHAVRSPDHALPGVPWVESPFFDELVTPASHDAESLRVARDLHEYGFAVIDFPDPSFGDRADKIKARLHSRYDWNAWHSRGESMRIQDAWRFDEDVRALAVNQYILTLLSRIYGRRAWPFQTLNFPVGTQQHFHTDALHFNSVPERFMCGVWTALEDIDETCGPLIYYPGSHRLPIYSNEALGIRSPENHPGQRLYEPLWEALVSKHGIQPQRFTPRKGQALIWAANLLHGGDAHQDRSRTRWSQVTHYFFENCGYYTPMYSDAFLGKIKYRRLRNIETGLSMPNMYAGSPIPANFLAYASQQGLIRRAWNRLRRLSKDSQSTPE